MTSLKQVEACVLTVNGGSSSIKFALFEAGGSLRRILEGRIERIGLPDATFVVKGLNKADNFTRSVTAANHTAAVGLLMDWIEERIRRGELTVVGHRVVHGGPKYSEPQRITTEMVGELHQLQPFDPEHLAEDVRAAEAVALFCYQVKKWIGAFAAALGGLDTLVFAGGIGENAPVVRARICDSLGFLGIECEEKRNAANEGVISTATSRVAVRVIHTDEEWMIAKTVCRVLSLTIGKEKYDENAKD
jgi:acetate kinase